MSGPSAPPRCPICLNLAKVTWQVVDNRKDKAAKRLTENTTERKTTSPAWPAGVGWRLAVTYLTLVFEAIWPRLWPATGIAGGFLLLALWDIWLYVPGLAHLFVLVGCIFGVARALWLSFRDMRWPTAAMAIRRLERDNHFEHRPLSTYMDRPAMNTDEDATNDLWQQHRLGLGELVTSAKIHPPRSTLPARDPHALRALLALLLIPSFFVAGWDWRERISAAFVPDFSWRTPAPTAVEAWIDPPDYTGVAPIFLTSRQDTQTATSTLEVPANSLLVTRTPQQGAKLNLHSSAGPLTWISEDDPQRAARLEVSQHIELKQRGRTIGSWDFNVIADRAPAITLTEPIKTTIRQTLEIPFAARDDYGIEEASIQFSLVDEGTGSVTNDIFSHSLSLPSRNPQRVDETGYLDLTAHPWAGLPVSVQLLAIDAVGQIGRSPPADLTLPERAFLHPLAKAIIEQRRNLARAPGAWDEVAMALDVLATMSPDVAKDYTLFLGLRSAYWSLISRQPEKMSEIEDVYALLWDLALRMEDGDAAAAEQNMRMAQKALMDALAKGADPAEIERLMQAYNKALDDYLKALAEQAMSEDRQSQKGSKAPANAKQMRAEDLQKLLQDIQDLIQTGDTAAARELLAQLQRLMENLATGRPVPLTPEQARLTETIDELTDILNRQRSLLDETYAQRAKGAQQSPVQEEDLPAPGSAKTPATEGQPTPLQNLAPSQHQLGQDLGGLTDEISELAPGADGLEGLQGAVDAMQNAAQSLTQNSGAAAEEEQRRAIEALSQGANDLANQLMQQTATSSQRQTGGSEDPLGRTPGSATSLGDQVKVPSERDLQRARDILEELQKRAAESGRPTIELQYLERLLKRF
ncbi:MAG: TIGR02302 family protein [Alphaproteobacteria bacterium]|nr:MAG: TIGR02302 family protein [Alphaproteobacteria bacterium]